MCRGGMGTFVASFPGHQRSSMPPILWNGPPERDFKKNFFLIFGFFALVFNSITLCIDKDEISRDD